MRFAYAETVLLTALGALAVAVSTMSLHVDVLYFVYPADQWAERSDVLRDVITIFGSAVLLAGLVSGYLIRHNSSLSARCVDGAREVLRELLATWKWFSETTELRNSLPWLAIVTLTGAAVRGYNLTQPMRFDEAYTFLHFVNQGVFDLFFYPEPNNHVLHTLLARLAVTLVGPHPAAIRIPALIAGLCVIPLTYCFARLLIGRKSGYLASGLVAVYPYLVLFDTMARGYSLVVLLTLCLAVFGLRLIRHPTRVLTVPVSLLIAMGLWTIPTFLFPAVGIVGWVSLATMLRERQPLQSLLWLLIPTGAMSIALTAIFYTPTIVVSNGGETLFSNRFVTSLAWSNFWSELPGHGANTISDFTRDIPIWLILVGLTLVAFGTYRLASDRRWNTLTLFPALAFGGVLVLCANHAIPFARTWIYSLPFAFIYIDVGFNYLPQPKWFQSPVVMAIPVVCAALLLMHYDTVASYPDTGHFPEAAALADVLSREMALGDQVAATIPADAPLMYYMWYKSVPNRTRPMDSRFARRIFFIVKPSEYSIRELTDADPHHLLTIGDAELYVAEFGIN